MARVKRGNVARKRRNKILNLAKGFRGGNKNLLEQLIKESWKPFAMLIVIEGEEREISEDYGLQESMLQPELMVLVTVGYLIISNHQTFL